MACYCPSFRYSILPLYPSCTSILRTETLFSCRVVSLHFVERSSNCIIPYTALPVALSVKHIPEVSTSILFSAMTFGARDALMAISIVMPYFDTPRHFKLCL